MKIDSSIPLPVTQAKVRQPNPVKAETATSLSKTADASVATHLEQAQMIASLAAPIDNNRVTEIRQAIAEGRLEINPDKIASHLIDGVRELLTANRSVV